MHNQYGDLLKSREGLFLDVKQTFRIGEELGLCSVTYAHSYPTNGTLVGYKKIEGEDYFGMYGVLGFGTGEPNSWYRFSETQPLIIRPKGPEEKLYLVSVYHRHPFFVSSTNFIGRLGIPQLTGLFAHECTEYLHFIGKIPEGFGEHQQRMDRIAQQCGYGDELISLFEAKIGYLTEDNGKIGSLGMGDTGGPINTSGMIQKLEERIKLLKI